MPEGQAPRRQALDAWRAERRGQREAALARLDDRTALWSGVVLVLMMLFMMIGPEPYTHQVTVDALSGGSLTSPLNRMVWLAVLALSLPIIWVRRSEFLALGLRVWPLLLLFVWFGATTRWAIDPVASDRRYILYLINLVVGMALAAGLHDARRMHAALATACAIIILVDLFSWVAMPGKSMTEIGLAAIHNHKNTLGSVMLLSALVIMPYILFARDLKTRLFWVVMFAGCLALLVASKSKTSLAIVLVTVVLTPALLACLRLRAGALLAAAALAVASLLALAFSWLAWCYVSGLDPLYPFRELTFTRRTDVWMFALGQFVQHPITGQGFASFWDVDPSVQPSLRTGMWFAQSTYTNQSHNGYFDLLVTTGAPGLIGALFLLLRWMGRGLGLVRECLRAHDLDGRLALPHALFLGVFPLMFFAHNFMESSYFTANSMFGIIILLVGIDIDMRHATPLAPTTTRVTLHAPIAAARP